MTRDLRKQRDYAQQLVEVLNDFVEGHPTDEVDEDGQMLESYELTAMAILDALGLCGLTLQPGNDAGIAYLDALANQVKLK